jgi:tRNA pseudouridine38-40 synthase
MSRIVLQLEYDGSRWCGWQTQPQHNTLQDTLESAIQLFCPSESIKTVCSGRTDAGVHAFCQVVHFDTNLQRKDWVRGINAFLPNSMSVVKSFEVAERFHARFSALSRTYSYLILNRRHRSALCHARAGWVFYDLDVDLMSQAAQYLVGEYDFSCFRAAQCQAKTPVRNVMSCVVKRRDAFVTVVIQANAFLHHMVRNIVSALVEVGIGRRDPAWIAELIEAKNREIAPPTFAPDGLFFTDVAYPAEFALSFDRSLSLF